MASVSACTVRRWSRQGLLTPVVLPSGGLRFKRDQVLAILGLDKAGE